MSDSVTLLDPFVRGIAAGAMAVTALSVWRSGVSRQARWVILALGVGTIAWIIGESPTLWAAFGSAGIVPLLDYPVGGLFWLFVLTVFEDHPVTPVMLAPPTILVVLGVVMNATPALNAIYWPIFNGFAGLLALHAGVVIVRGWRDDLIERRRRLRGLLLGLVVLFVVGQIAVAFISRTDPGGPWSQFKISEAFGGAMFAALILGVSMLFLQAQPAVFGGSRRADAAPDPRAEAADRLLLGKLDTFVAAEGWRREGLSIGALANELEVPEHRLRRLINSRLGHRNFADFLNASRIEAAKQRLADPKEARTTVAAIAFDLGYGSLGPFNRAFRAATSVAPTEWRRQALLTSPDSRKAG
jgi:AraC-like DNA-binding protein